MKNTRLSGLLFAIFIGLSACDSRTELIDDQSAAESASVIGDSQLSAEQAVTSESSSNESNSSQSGTSQSSTNQTSTNQTSTNQTNSSRPVFNLSSTDASEADSVVEVSNPQVDTEQTVASQTSTNQSNTNQSSTTQSSTAESNSNQTTANQSSATQTSSNQTSSSESTADSPITANLSTADTVERKLNLSDELDTVNGVENIGYFEIHDSDQQGFVRADAVFFEVDIRQANPVTEFIFTEGDSCEVRQLPNGTQNILTDIEAGYTTISAGEAISMSEKGSSSQYSELVHRGSAREGRYIASNDLPHPSPQALNISAGGEEFNAFALTVEKPSFINRLSLVSDRAIAPGTTVTWGASTDTDTMLSLVLQPFTDDVVPYVINCLVVDDGEFTLPSNIDAILSERTVLQVARRLRVGSTRVGNDYVIMVRGSEVFRSFSL